MEAREQTIMNIGHDHLCICYHEVQLRFEEPSKSNCNDQIDCRLWTE